MTEEQPQKIYKSLVPMDNAICHVDTIEYQGLYWLVPEWLETPNREVKMPARIIRLLGIPHQQTIGGKFGDFVVSQPIPKAVWNGQVPPEQANVYLVIDRPPIRIVHKGGLH